MREGTDRFRDMAEIAYDWTVLRDGMRGGGLREIGEVVGMGSMFWGSAYLL